MLIGFLLIFTYLIVVVCCFTGLVAGCWVCVVCWVAVGLWG